MVSYFFVCVGLSASIPWFRCFSFPCFVKVGVCEDPILSGL